MAGGDRGLNRFSLEGRVAIVTGGGRGIGRAIAGAFAEAGARVALVARSADELERAAAEIGGHAYPADVSDPAAVDGAVAAVRERFERIDVLVNAAGISPVYKRAERIEPAEWDAILAVNLRGTFLCCRAVGPAMLERGAGAVVNITSVAAAAGMPRLAAYAASKAGVLSLTRTLALEWAAQGVRVNAVGPSFVRTEFTRGLYENDALRQMIVDQTPLGRFGEPDDVVGAALFLASDASRYVTGETIYVDGGWLAR